MASGRSARLPQTPTQIQQNANVVRRLVDNNGTIISHHHGYMGETTTTMATVAPSAAMMTNVIDSNDAIDTFAPNLMTTSTTTTTMMTTQMLEKLSERERQIILDVLNRDEEVRQRDGARIL